MEAWQIGKAVYEDREVLRERLRAAEEKLAMLDDCPADLEGSKCEALTTAEARLSEFESRLEAIPSVVEAMRNIGQVPVGQVFVQDSHYYDVVMGFLKSLRPDALWDVDVKSVLKEDWDVPSIPMVKVERDEEVERAYSARPWWRKLLFLSPSTCPYYGHSAESVLDTLEPCQTACADCADAGTGAFPRWCHRG